MLRRANESAAKSGGAGMSSALALAAASSVPVSEVNRQYAILAAESKLAQGGTVPYSGAAAVAPDAHEVGIGATTLLTR